MRAINPGRCFSSLLLIIKKDSYFHTETKIIILVSVNANGTACYVCAGIMER